MKELFVIILLLSLSLTSCQSQESSYTGSGAVSLTVSVLGKNETANVSFENSSLLDILQNNCIVKTKDTLITQYIECVDNICGNDKYSWVYYINGQPMNQGVSDYKVRNKDDVLVVYKKI